MRTRNGAVAGLAIVLLGLTGLACAADDSKNSREREMLRRAQEALRQSQSDNSALAQTKAETEQKLKSAAAQLDAARNSSKSEQASLRAKLKTAAEAEADVARQLEEAKRQIATLTTQQQETASRLTTSESQLKQTRLDLDSSRAAGASCEAKNLKLYEYSYELAQRYHKKGVWAALSQKEPVLGIGGVKTENVVQEYQDKFDSQRVQPGAPAAQRSQPAPPPASPSQRSPPAQPPSR
jgi:chromosome segregation ATPase